MMEHNEELQLKDHPTSFSQLLFGDDDDDVLMTVDHPALPYSSLFSIGNGNNTPKMLCFGDHQNDDVLEDHAFVTNTNTTESSSASNSSCNNHNNNHKKRNGGSGQETVRCTDSIVTAASGGRRQSKKTKSDIPGFTTGHAKKKEKLGERIAALQQLVSPFGKTDTASVLHEAMGYIRFLHDQVQVLCSPYLQRLPSSSFHHEQQPGDGENKRDDLRSRGLCLIPVESTLHVASTNGADFWSPAMASHTNINYNNNNVSSSTRQ